MKYDLIIIGGGPAGLSAAIYAARYKINTLIISKTMGGTAATANLICNFPSYKPIKGFELMRKFTQNVSELNVPIIYEEVKEIRKEKEKFIVKTDDKSYEAKKIIFAAGTRRQHLNVPGEGKFYGKGVSYCATCDAPFYKNREVIVVGGSDGALTSALLLSEFATNVLILYRGNKFEKADPTWVDIVNKNKKIKQIFNEEISEVLGDKNVSGVKLKSGKNLKCYGIFVEIGSLPEVEALKEIGIKLTNKNYIICDKEQRTNIPGIYAAGDITNNSLKQIITASGEGAVAAYSAYHDLKEEN